MMIKEGKKLADEQTAAAIMMHSIKKTFEILIIRHKSSNGPN